MTVYPDSNAWTLEPELDQPVPRAARLTPMAQFSRIFAIVLWIGITITIFAFAMRDINDLKALLVNGRETNALVSDKYITYGKSKHYHLTYRYDSDGQSYSDDTLVNQQKYDSAYNGSELLITYLPSHPTTDRAGVVDEARLNLQLRKWVTAIGVASLLLAGFCVLIQKRYQSRLLLLQFGVPVAGVVTASESRRVSKNTMAFYLTYTYKVDGEELSRQVSVPGSFYDSVFPGVEITILYQPNNPQDSVPYRTITDVVL